MRHSSRANTQSVTMTMEVRDHVDVDLWIWRLDASREQIAFYETYLSKREKDRADRFYSSLLRDQFVASHGRTREILARYIDAQPAAISFALNEFGKPEIAFEGGAAPYFNLSHSKGLAALAVCEAAAIGVDIEAIRPVAVDDLASSYFSAAENQDLLESSAEDRIAAFFRCWTRKEAFLKAVGDGLSIPLDSFDVECRLDHEPRLRWVEDCPGASKQWSIRAFEPEPGWAGAVAVKATSIRLLEHFDTAALV